MERTWWWKTFFLVLCTALAGLYVYPTLSSMDVEKSKFFFKQKINLGLDLQGGLYMVMGVDFNKVYKDVVDRQAHGIETRLREKHVDAKNFQTFLKKEGDTEQKEDPRVSFEYDGAKHDAVYQILKDEFWTLRITADEKGKFELGLSHQYRADVREKTIDQSIEVIRNRIDEFGVSEPTIASQGTDRVVIELPGVKDVERAKGLIGRTAKLEFKIVDDKRMPPPQLMALINQIETEHKISFKGAASFADYTRKMNEYAKGKLPAGDSLAFSRETTPTGETLSVVPYLVIDKAEVTGEHLQDAQVQFDPNDNTPSVGFTLNPRGAVLFGALTKAHIQERLAIVLDNIIHSAPVIQTEIGGGRGQITLGRGNRNDLMKEAKDLSIVLRAGALPAQLEFLEQRVIGPSLGQDSIRLGGMASLIGVLAVFLFTIFYYRMSGVIAVVSLIMNIIFVLAVLVGLEATLTLPGIAGIALTVGIAVDSNVVIYERIREELRAGKAIAGAVEAGFQKALRTILDANVTNAAAALVLLNFGTGPIKGFAITMLIGIVTTMFTAVFVCKVFFDLYLKRLEGRPSAQLSI
ncbi:MAG: protein translocase subunit SecD [Bacteriovoracia bacterium]